MYGFGRDGAVDDEGTVIFFCEAREPWFRAGQVGAALLGSKLP
jgi:hypothetical protein